MEGLRRSSLVTARRRQTTSEQGRRGSPPPLHVPRSACRVSKKTNPLPPLKRLFMWTMPISTPSPRQHLYYLHLDDEAGHTQATTKMQGSFWGAGVVLEAWSNQAQQNGLS